MESIALAKAYNGATGATITHRDVGDFGYIEFAKVEAALKMLGRK